MTSDRITMLESREKPDARVIIDEIRAAMQNAQSMGVLDKISQCHMIRRCLWDNQSPDCKKHGLDATPYDGAMDSKTRVAEKIIGDHVRIRMSAVRSGNVQIGPENETEDQNKAQLWDSVLKYYRNQVKRSMTLELKLFYTCVEEFGYGIMHIDWQDRKVNLPHKVNIDQIVSKIAQTQLEQASQQSQGQEVPPEVQQQIAEQASDMVHSVLVEANPEMVASLLLSFDDTMPESEAKRAAKELIKNGEATYYAPRGKGGLARVKAMVPWVNVLHGIDLNASEPTSWYGYPENLNELDTRLKAADSGWTAAALEKVLEQKNRTLFDLTLNSYVRMPEWVLNGVGIGLSPDRNSQYQVPMFQIITVYRMAMNEAGIPAMYATEIHPMIPDMVLSHKCLDISCMPFVVEAREPTSLVVQSRGIPEMVDANQVFQKKIWDGTSAAAELAAYPPSVIYMGNNKPVLPGATLTMERNSGSSGAQSRFLEVPGVDMGALKAMEMDKMEVAELFHRGNDADPDMKRMLMEDIGASAVMSYEEMVKIIWSYVQAYVTNVKASRIAGRAVSIEATSEDLMGSADITIEFSPMALNRESAKDLADFLTKIVPLDRNGRLDSGAGVEVVTRMYDPYLAEKIVLPGDAGAQQIEDQEQSDIAKLVSGQIPPVRQGSEQLRLKKIDEWMQNPTAQAMMQSDQTLAQRMQQRYEAYQFAIQQQDNAVIGRTGYDPSKDPVLGQGQQQGPEAMAGGAIQ
jgi:hypothetical protein